MIDVDAATVKIGAAMGILDATTNKLESHYRDMDPRIIAMQREAVNKLNDALGLILGTNVDVIERPVLLLRTADVS